MRPVRIFGCKQDITSDRLAIERLRQQAETDPLTGLANRATLADEIERAVVEAGLDVLCLTDHSAIKGAVELAPRLEALGCRVVVGEEMKTQAGELIGLIFDGNIQSLSGNYVYTERQSRSVSVNSGAIREALKVVYGATTLEAELGH